MIKNDENSIKINHIKHYMIYKKFNFIFPAVVAFIFSFLTFIYSLGIYNVGSVSLKNSK